MTEVGIFDGFGSREVLRGVDEGDETFEEMPKTAASDFRLRRAMQAHS
jgi:hypothetical protein